MKQYHSCKLFILFISITFLACSKSGGYSDNNTDNGNNGGGVPNTVSVDINAMSFSPTTVTVKVGTIVKWNNLDYYSTHTVTSDNGTTFNSGTIAIGSSYSYTTSVAGTFPYHCTVHGGMNGTLVVNP